MFNPNVKKIDIYGNTMESFLSNDTKPWKRQQEEISKWVNVQNAELM
jgi:hypothetical protein